MKTPALFLLYILAVFCLLTGCKTSRNIESSTQKDYTKEMNGLSAQMDSLMEGFRLSQRQITDKLSNLKVEHTATYYTLPDSTGKQYPVYVSTTKADKDEQTTEKTYTELDAIIRRLEQQMDNLSGKVDAALKEQQKVAEISWWNLHKWQVLGVAVALAIIAWLARKTRKE